MAGIDHYLERAVERAREKQDRYVFEGKNIRVDDENHAKIKAAAREVGADMYGVANVAIELGLEGAKERFVEALDNVGNR